MPHMRVGKGALCAVPTIFSADTKMMGTQALCPPYGYEALPRGEGEDHRQCNNRVSSQLISRPTASPNSDRITTPANS